MYFPIFRGRQSEMLALRECVDNKILHKNIIPIVEPVRATSTFTKTLDTFITNNYKIAIIQNPIVGSWYKDLNKTSNEYIKYAQIEWLNSKSIIPAIYVDTHLKENIEIIKQYKYTIDEIMLIHISQNNIDIYNNIISEKKPKYNLIPDKRDFRRGVRHHRILCEDHFQKQERNIDYFDIKSEFFSSDHIYYKDDGYEGFSDYSVIGAKFSEIGFAPYAIAIHIVYFDEKNNLQIAHFVSNSNNDISNPAGKFAEAAKKLSVWNKQMKIKTYGIDNIEEYYNNEIFPGLGVIKKLSIMHHLELMSNYFDEAIR